MTGIGTSSPASDTMIASTRPWLIMLPSRRIIRANVRVASERKWMGASSGLGSMKCLK